MTYDGVVWWKYVLQQMAYINPSYFIYSSLKENVNWIVFREILLRLRNYQTSLKLSRFNYNIVETLEYLFYDKVFFKGFIEEFNFWASRRGQLHNWHGSGCYMVYTSYSEVSSSEFQAFGSKYVDLALDAYDSRESTKYLPISDFLHKEESNRDFDSISQKAFMFSGKFLEATGSEENVALKEHMSRLKKKKQNQKSGKKSISFNSSDYINLPKWMRVSIRDYYFFLFSSFFYMTSSFSIIDCHLYHIYSLYLSSDLFFDILPKEPLGWYSSCTPRFKEYNFLSADQYNMVGYYPGLIKDDYRIYSSLGNQLYGNVYPFMLNLVTS